jgi:anti-sigma regulatory factor (Ser/Thr protein kinase)
MKKLLMSTSLDNLSELQAFLTDGLPKGFAALSPSIELILEEFLVNIHTYAYGGSPGPLEVCRRLVSFDGKPHLAVMVRDWGPPFDPFSDSLKPDVNLALEEREVGGLGLHLIKNLASHFSYYRSLESNMAEVWFRQTEEET